MMSASVAAALEAAGLPRQSELLKKPWRVLLVLDACRADYACQEWSEFRVVRSLGGITHQWLDTLWRQTDEPMTVLTANPSVSAAYHRYQPKGVTLVDIWRDRWRDFAPHNLGTVPPADVTDYVRDLVDAHGQCDKMVVFYLQPHTPYIRAPLPVQVGNTHDGPTPENKSSIPELVKCGRISWQQVQNAYRANLRWVLPEVKRLADMLEGPVKVTADHGEALGDEGLWGHANVPMDLIRWVPWLDWRSDE